MKLKVPLSRKDEVQLLIEAGADELYCGVCYKDKKGKVQCSGKGTVRCQLQNLKELKETIQLSESYETPISLVLNKPIYPNYEEITYIAEKAASFGINSFIISDETLLNILSKLNLNVDIHISCLTSCYNTESIKFYKEMGAKRITLPRMFTIKEIEYLSKKIKGVDLELMIYTGRDKHDNGLCRFNHPSRQKQVILSKIYEYKLNFIKFKKLKDFKTGIKLYRDIINSTEDKLIRPCMTCYDIKPFGKSRIMNNLNLNMLRQYFNKNIITSCGICSLFSFNKFGIKSVKLVGREGVLLRRFYETLLIKKAINLLEKCTNKKQFETYAKQLQYKFTKDLVCQKTDCYYY